MLVFTQLCCSGCDTESALDLPHTSTWLPGLKDPCLLRCDSLSGLPSSFPWLGFEQWRMYSCLSKQTKSNVFIKLYKFAPASCSLRGNVSVMVILWQIQGLSFLWVWAFAFNLAVTSWAQINLQCDLLNGKIQRLPQGANSENSSFTSVPSAHLTRPGPEVTPLHKSPLLCSGPPESITRGLDKLGQNQHLMMKRSNSVICFLGVSNTETT